MCAVGLIDRMRFIRDAASAHRTAPAGAIASPLSESNLLTIVYSDVYGAQAPVTLTRDVALGIPGVFKGRALLLSLLAGAPLVAFDAAELDAAEREQREPVPLEDQPAWLTSTAGAVSPWHRMAWTIDDCIFYGWSLWVRKNAAGGGIEDAQRIPKNRWKFGEDGVTVLVDAAGDGIKFEPVGADDVILIPGASEGLLAYAARVLNGAQAIDRAWVDRAENPLPMIELHQTVESNLQPAEAQAVVDKWNAARKNGGGAAFTPYDISANALGQYSADLYIEGRNASRLDVANFMNLPASLLDGSTASASLTYSSQEGDANEVAIYTVPYWRDPIIGRLSQDDVAGPGVVIRQNLGSLVRLPQSPTGGPGNE